MRSLVTQSFRMILHICSTELHSTELSSLRGTFVKEYLRVKGHGKDRGRAGGVRPRDCRKVGITKYYNSCRVCNKEYLGHLAFPEWEISLDGWVGDVKEDNH